MENIVRNVRDIQFADRQALEHVIGLPLAEHQQVVIRVVDAERPPSAMDGNRPTVANPNPEIPAWWRVYEGLSDEEVDKLDEAIRQRANLTRIFE